MRYEFEDFNSSVEHYRRDISKTYKRIENEHDNKPKHSDFKRNVQQLTQPVQNLGRDAIMHAKINDPTTNEIRNVKRTASMITGFASGAALAIASVAVSAIQASELDERSRRLTGDMRSLESDYAHLEASINQADEDRRSMTLSSYTAEVNNRNNYYEADYYDKIERHDEIVRENKLAERDNKKDYDNAKKLLSDQRSSAEADYKRESDSLKQTYENKQSEYKTQLSESKSTYDQTIVDLDKRYNNKISDVQKSTEYTPEQKKDRIASINRDREDERQRTTIAYNDETRKIKEESSLAKSEYKQARSELDLRHTKTMDNIQQREEGLKSTYNEKRNELNKRESAAAEARDEAKRKFESAPKQAIDNPRTSGVYIPKPQEVALQTRMGYVGAQSLENVKQSINGLNKDLAQRAIKEVGTPEQAALLDKYITDNDNRKNHPGPGPYTSKLSDEERHQVNTMLKAFGYAGSAGFTSNEELKATIKNSQRTADAIQVHINENKRLIAGYNREVQELNGMRDKMVNSMNAKKTLASGKNLSAEQKENLKKKVLSSDDEEKLRALIASKEKNLPDIKKVRNDLRRQEATVEGIRKQNEFLKRNGKALVSGAMYVDTKKSLKYKERADAAQGKAKSLAAKSDKARQKGDIEKANKLQLKAQQNKNLAEINSKKRLASQKRANTSKGSKTGKKLAKKAERKWKNSTRALQKRLEAKTLTGNSLHRELKNLKRGMKNAAQYYTMGVNGAIIITKFAGKTLLAPLTITNFIGKRLNTKHAKIIGKTKVGQKLLNTKLLRGSMKFNNKLTKFTNSKGFKHVTKAGKGFLMAPAAVLNLPNKIMNLPQTMMMGAAKGTVKVAGKTLRVATKPLGKGVRVGGRAIGRGAKFIHRKTAGKAINKVKNSRFARAARKNAKKLAAMAAKPFKKAAQKVKNFFNKKAFLLIRKLFAMLFSIISSIASYVMMFILYLLLFLILLMVMLLLIVMVISIIFSVIAMILDWLYKQTAQADTEIANNPGYILHMASNYRAEELRIFHYFHTGAKRKNTETDANNNKLQLEVSSNPLWFEVYDSDFKWSNMGSYVEAQLKNKNGQAETVLQKIKNQHQNKELKDSKPGNRKYEFSTVKLKSSNWNKDLFSLFITWLKTQQSSTSPEDWEAKADVTNYSDLWVAYLKADHTPYGDLLDANGNANKSVINQKLDHLEKDEGKYEISNAKDALACADSIFQSKQDECQTYEILAYLGVGATQPTDSASNSIPASETLFWTSHNIVYLSGTKVDDIYYHATADISSPKNGKVNTSLKGYDSQGGEHYGFDYFYGLKTGNFAIYRGNGSQIDNPKTNRDIYTPDVDSCNNKETRVFSFNRAFPYQVVHPRHTHNNSLYTTQAKAATTKKNQDGTNFNPTSTSNDYWYWYQDLGDLGFSKTSYGTYKPSYTEAGNLKVFLYDVWKQSISVPSDMVSVSDYADTIHIKDCWFNRLYVIKSGGGDYLIAGKSTKDNKFYQVVNTNDAYNILQPIRDGKLGTYVNGSSWVEADIPFVLVFDRDSGEDSSDGNAYVPKIYYKRSSKDAKVAISNSVTNYGFGWNNFRKNNANMNDLCKNHSGLSTNHKNTVTEIVDVPCTEKFEICHGHITLRTVVVVTTAESKYSIFDKAAQLPKQSENYSFGIYYKDELAGVDGWGGVLVKAFDPSEDFGEHGSARGLALAKAREKNIFYEWDSDYDDKVKNYYLRGIGDGKTIHSIAKAPGNKVAWAMFNFDNGIYYTTSLKSGDQKNLDVFKYVNDSNSSWVKEFLSLQTKDGKAHYEEPNKVS